MSLESVAAAYAAKAQECADAFLGGLTVAEVARELWLDQKTVKARLRFAGIDYAQVKKDRAEARRAAKREASQAARAAREAAAQALAEETAERFVRGESMTELAKRYGVSTEAIRQRIHKAGTSPEDLRDHLFYELDFLCGTDSFDGLCARLNITMTAVKAMCERYDRMDLYRRLSKTRITNYTEDQNVA